MTQGTFTASSGVRLGYLLQRTGGETAQKLPLLIYLHGGDGVGTDPQKLLRIESVPQYLENGKLKIKIPALIASPQCPPGTKWYTLTEEMAEFVRFLCGTLPADPDRVSVTGCSLGGMGTFSLACTHPELFSCAVPVCGSVRPADCAAVGKLPLWIFHGEQDDGMGFSAVEANCVINASGGASRLTLLHGEGHEIRRVYYEDYHLVKWMLDRSRREFSGTKKLIFIGSSVCVGTGADGNRGWSRMLAERLWDEDFATQNVSVGGQTTADILLRLERDVLSLRPDACVVGLGLANEGLHKTADAAEAEAVRAVFDANMRKIISVLQKKGIRTACGGVYPNNRYTEYQYETLQKENRLAKNWGVPVFDWLGALDDGAGHFREGLYADAGHPSDRGYAAMYACVPAKIFSDL